MLVVTKARAVAVSGKIGGVEHMLLDEMQTTARTKSWVAVAYGVLDVTRLGAFPDDVELLVVPARPHVPLALKRKGAALWRRMVAHPVPDAQLDDDEREIVHDMLSIGLATADPEHPARICEIPTPWLYSPLHELVYALVQSVARENAIRLVFIKGPILHRQGLRLREHSGDVDLWVQPGLENDLAKALAPWGWTLIPFDFHPAMYHSLTLEPTEWGCEIDIHYRFPGIGVSPATAFSVLADTAQEYEFAGVRTLAPARPAGAVLSALHTLRPEPGVFRPGTQPPEAVAVLRAGGAQTFGVAERLGAVPVLWDALAAAFPGASLPGDMGKLPAEWKRRLAPSAAAYHLTFVRSLPWSQRPGATIRVLWPSVRKARLSSARRGGAPTASPVAARFRRLQFGAGEAIKATRQTLRRLCGRRT
ncbi:hypothetical protein [Microbacterium sp.]|uniref:hypothetical protein n=1 Tax=Microbacterium sp. TaxID=51671 RepID=UPI003C71B840